MKTIQLHGVLADKYGETWRLDVQSPAEALRAINCNKPGFFQYLIDSEKEGIGYQVMIDNEDIEAHVFVGPFSDNEVFHLIPVISGAGAAGQNNTRSTAKIVVGVVLVAVAVVAAGFTGGASLSTLNWAATSWSAGVMSAGSLAMFGAALVFSGVAGLITGVPKMEDTNPEKNKGSYLFNGPVNTVTQGGPVPIGYGEAIVGGVVISASIQMTDIEVDA